MMTNRITVTIQYIILQYTALSAKSRSWSWN